MDKDGIFHEHSKLKLRYYKDYLEIYLNILINVPAIKKINVYDLFAGIGMSDNGDQGSAMIAAKAINKVLNNDKNNKKDIKLFVNDVDPCNVENLKNCINEYEFAEITNSCANKFIEALPTTDSFHINEFFFIDPYGYTQISKQNLKVLLSRQRSECLIFCPTNHIYRFSKYDIKSAETFLKDLEITVSEKDRHYQFSKKVMDALKRLSGKKFCLRILLENKQNTSNKYGLFFITDHILGAEKFLETKYKLEVQESNQYSFIEEIEVSGKLKDAIGDSKINNVELYERLIMQSLLPQKVKTELQELENKSEIVVTPIDGHKRHRKSYYLDYKYFKKNDKKITFKVTNPPYHASPIS